jgi:recombination protein RecT
MTDQSDALVKSTFTDVAVTLEKKVAHFDVLLEPYGMKGMRFIQVVIDALGRNPKLLECERQSIIRSAYYAASIGLELGGPLGDAYLVPFWNSKKNRREAQCIPGYRGLMHIARAADPRIVYFDAQCVHESDGFTETRAAHPDLVHIPSRRDRGPVVAVYAVAFLKVPDHQPLVPQFATMGIDEVNAIRDASLAKMKEQWMRDDSPWSKSEPEMQKKTAVRRLVKMLDLRGTRAAQALDLDAREYGEQQTARVARVDDLKARLGAVPAEVVDDE